MKIDYSKILTKKFPGQEWTLDGDDFDGLTWLSDTPKPTKETLDGLWDEVKTIIEGEKNAKLALRESAISKLAELGLTVDELKEIIG
jgi:hypothetical protein